MNRTASRMRFPESPEYQRLLEGVPGIDLVRVALEVAQDQYPAIDPERYLLQLDRLAERITQRIRPGAQVRAILSQINWALYIEEGYTVVRSQRADSAGFHLNHVIDQRQGSPIALAVLYMGLAERLGVRMGLLHLPGRIVLRVLGPGPAFLVDPAWEGMLLDGPNRWLRWTEVVGLPWILLADLDRHALSRAQVVVHLLRHLKVTWRRTGTQAQLLPLQRRLTALCREVPREQRDLGLLCVKAGRNGEAIAPLTAYLQLDPLGRNARPVREALSAALREIATCN